MKHALIAISACTVAATIVLGLSVMVLRPPRANVAQMAPLAVLFLAQGGLTILATRGPGMPGRGRWPLLGGAAAVAWIGLSAVRATLGGSHFEGYALVLGSALMVQGALTWVVFARPASGPRAGSV